MTPIVPTATTAIAKSRLWLWAIREVWRLGRPEVALGFFGGIGDDLLCTAAVEEWLRRGARRIWFFTRHPELYSHYDRRVRLIPEDARHLRLARAIGRPMRQLSYSRYDNATDRDSPLAEHIVAAICRRAGLTGRVALRPGLTLNQAELQAAHQYAGGLVVQSAGLTAVAPMQNKQWPAKRMQAVVDHFRPRFQVVQIGSPSDQLLQGSTDLRGRTSLRETAAILAQARLFVGLVGFPMHLARAVDCPAVIVYGGREPAALTGYSCNVNLEVRPSCSPCWQRTRCDQGRACLEAIAPHQVIAAIEDALARPRNPLAFETQLL